MPGINPLDALVAGCVLLCAGCHALPDVVRGPVRDSPGIARLSCVQATESARPVDLKLETGSPEVRELVSAAHAHHRNGEPGLAINSLAEALDLEPGNRRVRTILGITLALEGYVNAAERQFIEALGVAEAHYNLGVILFELGEIKAAEQRFLIAVQHQPDLTQAHLWLDTARAELAAQTARWHCAITPLPQAPCRIEVRNPDVNSADDLTVVLTSTQEDVTGQHLPEITPSESGRVAAREQIESAIESRPATNPYAVSDAVTTAPQPRATELSASTHQRADDSLTAIERTELDHLRAEAVQLRIERDILKKAIGVIAGNEL